jgi:hypothetical protein
MIDKGKGFVDSGTLDFDCAPEDAVFFRVVQPVMIRSLDQVENVIGSYVEAINHLKDIDDDRAIILVCALVLENGVEACLRAFAPRYEQISGDRDLTFSMKSNFLKVLSLIPAKVVDAIGPIRKIRNEFAHTLKIKSFDDVEAKYFQALETHRRLILLQRLLRTAEFREYFAAFCKATQDAIE